jgi:CHAT domain-containing protein
MKLFDRNRAGDILAASEHNREVLFAYCSEYRPSISLPYRLRRSSRFRDRKTSLFRFVEALIMILHTEPPATSRFQASYGSANPRLLIVILAGLLILSGIFTARAQSDKEVRPLEPGKIIEREIVADETHQYNLALTAGHYLRVALEQEGFRAVAAIFGPDGKKLAEATGGSFSQRALHLNMVTGASGPYRLEVRSLAKNAASARYKLSIGELRAATDQDRSLVAAERSLDEATILYRQATAGSLQKAIEKYREALSLYRKASNRSGEATALYYIGLAYTSLDERRQAVDFFEQALALYRASGDRYNEAGMLYRIGDAYAALSEYQRAIDFYNQALIVSRAMNDRRAEAAVVSGIGRAYSSLGEHQKALESMDQVLTVFREASDRRNEAATLHTIGGIYISLGEGRKALESFNQSLSLFRALGDRGREASALNGIGSAYALLNEPEKALDTYNQALPLYRAASQRTGEAAALNNIGRLYLLRGEAQKALEFHSQALALIRAVSNRRGEARMSYNIARAHRSLGNLTEARSYSEAAIEIAESLRFDVSSEQLRTSFFASVRDFYELDIDLLMQMHKRRPSEGDISAAFETSERARARSLLELLAEARVDIRQGVDSALVERERRLGRLLNTKAERQTQLLAGKHTPEEAATSAKEIDALLAEYRQTQAEIRAASKQYARLTQPQPVSLKEIQQQLLDQSTLLLEYALGEERSYLWVVSPDSITGHELPARAEIESAARSFYELAKSASADDRVEEAGAALSRMLLGPAADRLETKRLVIIADGVLHYIPFAALPAPVARRSDAATKAPLIVSNEIVTLPSASVLVEMRRELADRKPAAKAVAVFADPVFSSDDPRLKTTGVAAKVEQALTPDLERAMRDVGVEARFQRLPFSRREAEAITAAVPRGQSAKALDFQASRDAATDAALSDYRVVHFATHGLLDSNNPELSGIVLSLVDQSGQSQNGFLRMHEIYNLKLPAELVVLSACRTGLGKDIRGEGLVGLTRGFMYAGAARIVASLWKVDDAATADLMNRFYRAMFVRRMRPAAALREAQVEMWRQKRWRSPYYWAAFVLQGEWR